MRYARNQGSAPGALEKVTLKTDLAQLDWAEVVKTFPDLEKAGIRGRLAGIFEANIDHYSLEPDGVETAVADIRLKDGEVSIKPFQSSFSRVNLDARLEKNNAALRDFSAGFAGGDLKISGTVDQPTTKALSEVKASLRDLSISELMPAEAESAAKLNGRISMEFQGKARGGQWPEISQTLSGRGQLSLRDGVIMNQNTLREVIDKISMIPTVGERLRTNFPPAYLAKLNEPNTVLKPVDLPFTITNGMIYFENLYLATDTFSITGGGEVGLNKTIHAKTMLRMDPQLSAGLINSAPQMQMLAGNQGQIEVPLRIDGVLPAVSVIPDINYIGQKIAMAKGQELITGLLTKATKSGGQQTAGAGTTGAAGSTQKETTEQSIANLFGKMLQKEQK